MQNNKDKSKKESLENYLANQLFELMTLAKAEELMFERHEFLDWVKLKELDYLFDFTREKTSFEWECLIDILSLLMHFDYTIEAFDKQFGKPIEMINNNLKNKMVEFSEKYKGEEE